MPFFKVLGGPVAALWDSIELLVLLQQLHCCDPWNIVGAIHRTDGIKPMVNLLRTATVSPAILTRILEGFLSDCFNWPLNSKCHCTRTMRRALRHNADHFRMTVVSFLLLGRFTIVVSFSAFFPLEKKRRSLASVFRPIHSPLAPFIGPQRNTKQKRNSYKSPPLLPTLNAATIDSIQC